MVISAQNTGMVQKGVRRFILAGLLVTFSSAFAQAAHAADIEYPGQPGDPGAPVATPSPPPVVNPQNAVLMLQNLQGNTNVPGEFTVDVNVVRNSRPVGAYAFEMHYGLDYPGGLVDVQDVDFGVEPEIVGDEWVGDSSRYGIVESINWENALSELTLCRLHFQVNASSSDVAELWLEAVEEMMTLLDIDGREIPVFVDNRYKQPMPNWSRDPDHVGDVTGRGQPNNIDAVALTNFILGNINSLEALENADVRADGILDFLDALTLFNWTIGNVPEIPVMPRE